MARATVRIFDLLIIRPKFKTKLDASTLMSIFFLFFVLSSNRLYGEMPEPPNYEELCEQSELVICASLDSIGSERKTINQPLNILTASADYYEHTFRVEKIYKGRWDTELIPAAIPQRFKGNLIMGCRRFPRYDINHKYILFLTRTPSPVFYIRTEIDDIWGERQWSQKDENYILEELVWLSDPDRWQKEGDHLDYSIPSDANELAVDLTDFQKVNGYSKRSMFYHNGELAGERAWYANGQLAYDNPVKNGLRHGVSKAWDRDGRLIEIRPYRKDRLHGALIRNSRSGFQEKTYWIRGDNVSKEKYEMEMKVNRSLPAVK